MKLSKHGWFHHLQPPRVHFYSAREEPEEAPQVKSIVLKKGPAEEDYQPGHHGAASRFGKSNAGPSKSARGVEERSVCAFCHSCRRSLRIYALNLQDAEFVRKPSGASQALSQCRKGPWSASKNKDTRCSRCHRRRCSSSTRSNRGTRPVGTFDDCEGDIRTKPSTDRACCAPSRWGSYVGAPNRSLVQQRSFFEYQRRRKKRENAAGAILPEVPILPSSATTALPNHVPVAAGATIRNRACGSRSYDDSLPREARRLQAPERAGDGPLDCCPCPPQCNDGGPS